MKKKLVACSGRSSSEIVTETHKPRDVFSRPEVAQGQVAVLACMTAPAEQVAVAVDAPPFDFGVLAVLFCGDVLADIAKQPHLAGRGCW